MKEKLLSLRLTTDNFGYTTKKCFGVFLESGDLQFIAHLWKITLEMGISVAVETRLFTATSERTPMHKFT